MFSSHKEEANLQTYIIPEVRTFKGEVVEVLKIKYKHTQINN